MKQKSFAGMRCPIARALDVVGDRWILLLVRDLSLGVSRYDDLRSSTGIPDATLSSRLKHLILHGIVKRVRYQASPPRDEYRLTSKGNDLWKVSVALREWGERWGASGFSASTLETVDAQTGHPLRLALVDPHTGMKVPKECVRLQAGYGADDTLRDRIDQVNRRLAK
ncbi:MAG TPA: helix-turn-helix domain-containing protein [Sphingobium sp.]